MQSPVFDGLSFDPFSFQQDGLAASEVDVGGGEVLQALVIAPMVVVIDEGLDLTLEVTRQVVVFQQDAVFERLMRTLDLTLGLRMVRGAADMAHAMVVEPVGQIPEMYDEPLSLSSRGLYATSGRLQPDACSASLSVSFTSLALMIVPSFQAMM